MLGFILGNTNTIKYVVIGLVFMIVGGSIYAGYRYVDILQTENSRLAENNATLQSNNAQLKQAIEEQKSTISSLRSDMQQQQQILNSTIDDFNEERNRADDLRERLGEHELGFLASEKPGLVENIINNASDEISRCFEIASGAPLTREERNASRPSEINSECPELANPNYRGNN